MGQRETLSLPEKNQHYDTMTITVQNLRSTQTGAEPTSLLPGQIAFNLVDKVLYVGNGSNYKTTFDGSQVSGVTGEGWYSVPLDFDSFGEYYIASPQYHGDTPSDEQILTWDSTLGHPVWSTGSSTIQLSAAPEASDDPGAEGQVAVDATYLYVNDGTTWRRVAWDTSTW